MLKTLIKRDGTKEPLIPSKLNGWSEWAEMHMKGRIEWSSAALAAVAKLPEEATTKELMAQLINELLDKRTYPAYMMAGRLYAVQYRKDIYGSITPPTVWQQHANLQAVGLMREFKYTREEYARIEAIINHDNDYYYPEYAIKFIREKYAIRNAVTGQVYETPQFVYMRMAMAIAESYPEHQRLYYVEKFYNAFSKKKLSAPTPNYLYLGTNHYGWASCCIYTEADDEESLAIGNYIAWKMTVNSAGLGSFMSTRTVGDPIAGGRVKHGGKYKYYDAKGKSTIANKQAARGGAGTTSFSAFDPEAIDIVQYRNPLMPADKQNRDLHFSMLCNAWFAMKVANNEDIFTFTEFSAPDLFDAFFSPDLKKFIELYEKYEKDESFPKKYVSARKLVLHSFGEAFDTGTAYLSFIDEMNRHTPFKISVDHRIHCSNLCQEVMEIQAPYFDMRDLYLEEDHGRGEIAMCNLAALPVDQLETEEEYAEAAELALRMIDHTILHSSYPFPHLAFTAKQRMNAGVGIMGLATVLARKGLRWDSIEGKKEIHRIFERHMYHLIVASIKISKERGVAPWIHKTKWPEGWTPLKTYNRNVDKIADFEYQYDWDEVSRLLIENGGLGHSVLCAMMPGESSSKALGSTNSVYPIRSGVIVKTDGDNNIIRWAAIDEDLLGDNYQSSWDISAKDLIECYAIMQKWCDQGISADMYRRFQKGETKVSEREVIEIFLLMVHYGLKSRYYTNTLRPKTPKITETKSLVPAAAQANATAETEAAPAAILDLDLLGSLTGVQATDAMLAQQDEYGENAKETCSGFCAL